MRKELCDRRNYIGKNTAVGQEQFTNTTRISREQNLDLRVSIDMMMQREWLGDGSMEEQRFLPPLETGREQR